MKTQNRSCKCKHDAEQHLWQDAPKGRYRKACGNEGCSCQRYKFDNGTVTVPTGDPIIKTIIEAVSGDGNEVVKRPELYTLSTLIARTVVKIPTGLDSLDKALSGGVVKNSALLLAGKRGCGKSTLMTVIAGKMAAAGTVVLYVSGEEDAQQFAYRANRMKLDNKLTNLHILDAANLDYIREYADEIKPGLIIIDSLQALYGKDLNGAFVANKRTANYFTHELRNLRKRHQATLILVGHETKQGEIAGDASLQHEVDAVLQLDPDEVTNAKVVKIDKNRFGEAPMEFRFLIHEDRLEEVKALPTLDYKAPTLIADNAPEILDPGDKFEKVTKENAPHLVREGVTVPDNDGE